MTSFKIALFQANAHRKDLSIRNFGLPRPLMRPQRQVTLMKTMRRRNFTLRLYLAVHGRERTSEDKTAGQSQYNELEQHGVEKQRRCLLTLRNHEGDADRPH